MTSSTTSPRAEQLTLLPEPTVPLRFRLDDATRRRGLRHIAEIRARLDRTSRPVAAVTPLVAVATSPASPALPTSPAIASSATTSTSTAAAVPPQRTPDLERPAA